MEIVMKYCAHGPLRLMALAWPKLHGPAKFALRPGLLGLAAHARSKGEAPMVPAAVAIDSGRWRHGEAGKPVGEHRGRVGPDLRGRGRTGAHREIGPWRCTLVAVKRR
jgi:hypothetical protein